MRRWLVTAGLPPPVPQFSVLVGEERYRIDYAYPDARAAAASGRTLSTGPPQDGSIAQSS